MQRVYSLLADAYGDTGKFQDAFDYYKKSADEFKADENSTAASLYAAAYTAYKKLNKPKDAIDLLKEIKANYSSAQVSNQADQLLAELGVYNTQD
jgi:tetratricopeptide (TPR) repeat protein